MQLLLALVLALSVTLTCAAHVPLGTPLNLYGTQQCRQGPANLTWGSFVTGVSGFLTYPNDHYGIPNLWVAADAANQRVVWNMGLLVQYTLANGTYNFIRTPTGDFDGFFIQCYYDPDYTYTQTSAYATQLAKVGEITGRDQFFALYESIPALVIWKIGVSPSATLLLRVILLEWWPWVTSATIQSAPAVVRSGRLDSSYLRSAGLITCQSTAIPSPSASIK